MFTKKRLISIDDEQRLVAAIKKAEEKTSGEVRVHIESKCKTDAIERAKELFASLNMNQTKERNGILFYLAIHSKQFAVWGDEGIHTKVKQDFWDELKSSSIQQFKNNKLIEGLEASIHACGEKLKHYFPFQKDDTNELTNDISY